VDRADAPDLTAIAVLSAPGRAALACIGVTGPGAADMLRTCFQPRARSWSPADPGPHVGIFSSVELRDEVVLRRHTTGPRAWWELTALGSPAVVDWIMDSFTALGAQAVSWETWLQLTEATWWQAELARLLLQAETERTAAWLYDQWAGRFGAALQHLAEIPEPAAREEQVRAWLAWEAWAWHLTHPWRVVLAGPPNAGKSTLLNALAGYDRAIADPTPGTTRDLVTARIVLEGWPVEIIDTAGLREPADALEAAGLAKAAQVRGGADLVLWLHALDRPAASAFAVESLTARQMNVWTKADLQPAPPGELAVSARTGQGIEELRKAIAAALVPHVPAPEVPLAASPLLAAGLLHAARGGSGPLLDPSGCRA
jgi:tRNA modification GTPase